MSPHPCYVTVFLWVQQFDIECCQNNSVRLILPIQRTILHLNNLIIFDSLQFDTTKTRIQDVIVVLIGVLSQDHLCGILGSHLITAANFCANGKFAVVGTYDGRCIFYDTEVRA